MSSRIVIDKNSLDFGTVAVSEVKSLSFIIYNYGASTLTGTLSCPNSKFVLNTTSFSINESEQQRIQVSFSSSAESTESANLTISSNDPINNSIIVPLTATVIKSSITAPSSLNFGTISVKDSKTLQVSITNNGTVKAIISNIASSNNTVFAITTSSLQIDPGNTSSFNVTFSSNTANIYSEHISLTTNSVSGNFQIPLSGVTISAGISLDHNSLDFGSVTISKTSTKQIVISNTSSVKLLVNNIVSDNSHFHLSTTTATILPSSSLIVYVSFSPDIEDIETGTITISSNDTTNSSVAVSVTGTGRVASIISVSSSQVDFSNVAVNSSLSRTITVSNDGQQVLHITSITVGSPYSVLPTTANVGINSSQDFQITFAPTTVGQINTTLHIVSDDPDATDLLVALTGTSISSQIVVSSTLDFGNTTVGEAKLANLVVNNSSSVPLQITNITVSDSHFSFVETLTFPITITNSRTFQLQLLPTDVGLVSGIVTISSNDYNNPSKQVTLTGTGIVPKIVLDKTSLDFGTIAVNELKTLSFIINNDSDASLTGTLSSPSSKFVLSTSSFSISSRGHQSISVTFSSNIVETVSSLHLAINSNDPVNSIVTVDLSAITKKSDIVTIPDSLDFGTISTTEIKTLQIQIINYGSVKAIISNIVSSNSSFTVSASSLQINPGSTANFNVIFSSNTENIYSEHLSLTTNSLSGNFEIPLIATTKKSDIVAAPSSLSFGTISVKDSKTLQVSITNNGTVKAIISNIASSNNTVFAITTSSLQIDPGNTSSFNVTFSSNTANIYSEHISLTTNSVSGNFQIPLSGVTISAGISLDHNSLDFGSVTISKTSTKQIVISNTSSVKLLVNNIVSDNSHFHLSTTTATILPSSSLIVYVSFSPDIEDIETGTITISSNDTTNSSVAVSVTGIGRISPIIIFPSQVSFDNVAVNSSLSRTIIVSNHGQQILHISNITIENNSDKTYVALLTSASIDVNESQTFEIVFSPKTVGQINKTLHVISDDPDSTDSVINLIGNSISSEIIVNLPLDFGSVLVGEINQASLIISNNSSIPLQISKIEILDNHFSFVEMLVFPITITDSRTFLLNFLPTDVGLISGTIKIYSNDYSYVNSSKSGQLTGTGIVPKIVVDKSSLDFGTIAVNESKTLSFTISNIGDATLIGTLFCPTLKFRLSTNSFSISALSSVVINVVFSSNEEFNGAVQLTISSNDVKNNLIPIPITLKAIAISSNISVDLTTLNFGTISAKDSKTLQLKIKNNASVKAIVSNIELSDCFTSSISAFELLPYKEYIVSVTFSSDIVKIYSSTNPGTLSIKYNGFTEDIVLLASSVSPVMHIYTQDQNGLIFGEVTIGKNSVQQIIITNASEEDVKLLISDMSCNNSFFKLSINNAKILKNVSLTVDVIFTPKEDGVEEGIITINSNYLVLPIQYINVSGSGRSAPIIKVSTNKIDFGNVARNSVAKKTFNISNIGHEELNITNFDIGDNVNYKITPVTATIAINTNKDFEVSFLPTTVGQIDTILNIVSDDPDSTNYNIELSGNSISSAISVNSQDFGNVTFGTSKTQNFVISNKSTTKLQISSISFSENNCVSFSNCNFNIVDSLEFPIVIQTSKTISINFKPKKIGKISCKLEIDSDDFLNPNKLVTLTGTGVSPQIIISPLSLQFSNVCVNTIKNLNFSIKNIGLGTYIITNIASSSSQFTIQPTTANLNQGVSQNFVVSFLPLDDNGTKGTTFTLHSNIQDAIVEATGIGVYPLIQVSTNALSFSQVAVNDSKSMSFDLVNSGLVPLVGTISVTGVFSVDSTSFNINVGTKQTINVTFSPKNAISYNSDVLTITAVGVSSPILISLSGVGTQTPKISVSPTSLNFNSIPSGELRTLQIKISNNGNMMLQFSTDVKNQINPGYSNAYKASLSSGNVGIGSNLSFDVIFTPQTTGQLSGTLIIRSNDVVYPTVNVSLSGEGILPVLNWHITNTNAWVPDAIKTISKALNDVSTPLINVLNATKKILDIIKVFIVNIDDPVKMLLAQIMKTIEDFLNDLNSTGIYMLQVLPGSADINPYKNPDYFRNFDFKNLNIFNTTGWFDPVKGGYNSFLAKIIKSFDDPGDGNRPQFSDSAMVGAFIMAIDSGSLDGDSIAKFVADIQKLLKMFQDKTFRVSYEPPSDIIAIAYDKVVRLTFTPSKTILPKEYFIFRSEIKGGDLKDEDGNQYSNEQGRLLTSWKLVGATNVALQLAYHLNTTFDAASSNILNALGSAIDIGNSFLSGKPFRFIFDDTTVENGKNYFYVIAAGYSTSDITFSDIANIITETNYDKLITNKYSPIIANSIRTWDFEKKIIVDSENKDNIGQQINPRLPSETKISNIGILSTEVFAQPTVFITSSDGMHRCRNYRCGFEQTDNEIFELTVDKIKNSIVLQETPIIGTVIITCFPKGDSSKRKIIPTSYYRVETKTKSIFLIRQNQFVESDILNIQYDYIKDLQTKKVVNEFGYLDSQNTYTTKFKPINVNESFLVFNDDVTPSNPDFIVINEKDGKIKINSTNNLSGIGYNFSYSYYSDFSSQQFFKCVIADNNANFFDVKKCDSGSTLCPKYDNANCYYNNGSSCTNSGISNVAIVNRSGFVTEDIPFSDFYDSVSCQNGIMAQRCIGYSKVGSRHEISQWPDWSSQKFSVISLFPQIQTVLNYMHDLVKNLLAGTEKMDSSILQFINLLEQKIDYLTKTIQTINQYLQNLIEDFSIPDLYTLYIPYASGGNNYLKTSLTTAKNGPIQKDSAYTAGIVLVLGTPGLADALKILNFF
jgi:hypothetical protein